MADKKISALTSLAQGDVAASTDVLPIVDTSATETKKITASALVGAGMTAGVTNVDINSGSIDGTTIGANSAAAGTFTNLTASGTVSFSGATVSNGGAVTTIDINGGTIDATSIGASSASTGAFTTLTTSSTVTLNGGTANGVLYLNGSKVATSGSALTFDGSYFTAASGTGTFLADIVQVSGTATKVNANGVGLEFRGGPNPNITSYSRVGSAYLPMTLDTSASIFSISGTEAMRITSSTLYTASGINVGIGTSSPGQKLEVANTSGSVAATLRSSNSGYSELYFADVADSAAGALSYEHSTNLLRFYNGGSVRATLDSSGNLGLGVTPSAWGSGRSAIEIGGLSYLMGTGNQINIGQNNYYNGTNFIYKTSAPAALYQQASGVHTWFNASSGTINTAVSFTQAMTLSGQADASLLLGTTSAAYSVAGRGLFEVNGSSSALIAIKSGDTARGYFAAGSTATELAAVGASQPLLFTTNSAERARISSDGTFRVKGAGTAGSTDAFLVDGAAPASAARITSGGEFYVNTTAAGGKFYVVSDLTANNGLRVDVPASFTASAIALFSATAAGTGWYFLTGESSGGSARIQILGTGDVNNANGTYGTISDARLKQDIVDAPSQWNDIKAIKFRKYRMKSDVEADPNAPALLGVVAQELAQVSPGLVDEHPNMKTVEVTDEEGNVTQTRQPTGTTTKTVKSSILLMKAAVALQEAMVRIEKLEAEMALLKGA